MANPNLFVNEGETHMHIYIYFIEQTVCSYLENKIKQLVFSKSLNIACKYYTFRIAYAQIKAE